MFFWAIVVFGQPQGIAPTGGWLLFEINSILRLEIVLANLICLPVGLFLDKRCFLGQLHHFGNRCFLAIAVFGQPQGIAPTDGWLLFEINSILRLEIVLANLICLPVGLFLDKCGFWAIALFLGIVVFGAIAVFGQPQGIAPTIYINFE